MARKPDGGGRARHPWKTGQAAERDGSEKIEKVCAAVTRREKQAIRAAAIAARTPSTSQFLRMLIGEDKLAELVMQHAPKPEAN